ncbi:hypothetical protein RSA31_20720 [Pantoea dispersa]|nr:hypothetical protein NS215_17235 [Pantoea dispersa]KTS85638.1 hypothetical protein RSA31_20720 [Pantoea dispersa]
MAYGSTFALTLTLSRWAGEGTVRRGGEYGVDLSFIALSRIFLLSRWAGEGTDRSGGKYGVDLPFIALFRIFPLSRWRERAGVRARAHHPSNSMQEAPHVIV